MLIQLLTTELTKIEISKFTKLVSAYIAGSLQMAKNDQKNDFKATKKDPKSKTNNDRKWQKMTENNQQMATKMIQYESNVPKNGDS